MNSSIEYNIQEYLTERLFLIDIAHFSSDTNIIINLKKLTNNLNKRKKPIDFLLSDKALSYYSCNKIMYLLLYYEKMYEAESNKTQGQKLKALNFKLSLIRDRFDDYYYNSFMTQIHPRDRQELKSMIK